MAYRIKPPSKSKVFKDKNGVKYSARDLSVVASKVNPKSSLIKFGEETYNKYDDSGYLFFDYEDKDKGRGYLVYTIEENEIKLIDIFTDCINKKEDRVAYEALIETVYNMAKSQNKDMVLLQEDDKIKDYISHNNQVKKEQKIEDKYWWSKE